MDGRPMCSPLVTLRRDQARDVLGRVHAFIGEISHNGDNVTARVRQSVGDERWLLQVGCANPTETTAGFQRRRMPSQSTRATGTLAGTVANQQDGKAFQVSAEYLTMTHHPRLK